MGKFNPNGLAPIIANGYVKALVQTVLPTIYDDSLSYFEVLGKVVRAVNTDTDNVNTLASNQTAFFNQLTEFVNNHVYDEVYTVEWNGSSSLSANVGAELEEMIARNGIARVHYTGENPYFAYLFNMVTVSDTPINKQYWFASVVATDINHAFIKLVRVEHTQTGFYIRSDNFNVASENYVSTAVTNAINYIMGELDTRIYDEVYTIEWNGSSSLSAEKGAKLEEIIARNGIARVHYTGNNPYYAYIYNTVNAPDENINKRYWFASIFVNANNTVTVKTVHIDSTNTGFSIASDNINFATVSYVTSVANEITEILDAVESAVENNTVVRVEFNVTKENGVYTYNGANKTPAELKSLLESNNGKKPIKYYAIVNDRDKQKPETDPGEGETWTDPITVYMNPVVSRAKTYVENDYYDMILISFTTNESETKKETMQFINTNDSTWNMSYSTANHFEKLSISARDTNGNISNIYSANTVESWYNAVNTVTTKHCPIVIDLALTYGNINSKYAGASIRTSEIYAAHTDTVKIVIVKFHAEDKTYTFTGDVINNTWSAKVTTGYNNGKLHLVTTITYDGNTPINITTDSENRPLKLTRAILRIKTGNAGESATMTLDAKYSNVSVARWYSSISAGEGYQGMCYIWQDGGYWDSEFTTISKNISTVSKQPGYTLRNVDYYPYIDSITAGYKPPEGSTMEVYGVDAY